MALTELDRKGIVSAMASHGGIEMVQVASDVLVLMRRCCASRAVFAYIKSKSWSQEDEGKGLPGHCLMRSSAHTDAAAAVHSHCSLLFKSTRTHSA